MMAARAPEHALPIRGRLYGDNGWTIRRGAATCTCGAQSEVLSTAIARREWHRQHKADAVAVQRRARLRLLGRDRGAAA